jgi:hypothetical protein
MGTAGKVRSFGTLRLLLCSLTVDSLIRERSTRTRPGRGGKDRW